VIAGLAAEFVGGLHMGFILFVVLGGLLTFRWPRAAWFHLPAAFWGAVIELFGWVCPLTPLENRLRAAAGDAGYAGGFIEHYVLPVIYPIGLTRRTQVLLGVAVIVFNLAVYGIAGLRRRNL
jgi:hypothetical protein